MLINRRIALSMLASLAVPVSARADDWTAIGDLSLLSGTGAGSNTNLVAQAFARAVRTLAPAATITVEDQPGASGKIMIRKLNEVGKLGHSIGFLSPGTIFRALLEPETLGPNPAAFGWIGNSWTGHRVLLASAASGLKTFDDLLRSPKPLFVPVPAANALSFYHCALINALTGAQLRAVPGFLAPSRALSILSGEVDCVLGPPDLIADIPADSGIQVILRVTDAPVPDAYASVPRLGDLIKDGRQNPLFRLIEVDSAINRPLAAGPGVSPDRLALLRKLFDAVLADPDFREAIKRFGADVQTIGGQEVENRLAAVFANPVELTGLLQAAVACGVAKGEGKACG